MQDLPPNIIDKAYPAREARQVLGVGRSKFYEMVADGELVPDGFVAGTMRFLHSSLMEFVKSGEPRTVLVAKRGQKNSRRGTNPDGPNTKETTIGQSS